MSRQHHAPDEQTRCSSCHAPIRWAVTTKQRKIPLDAEADPHGNLRLEPNGVAAVVDLFETPAQRAQPHYRSHFATCPNADQHRRS